MNNNPLKFVDPSGHAYICPGCKSAVSGLLPIDPVVSISPGVGLIYALYELVVNAPKLGALAAELLAAGEAAQNVAPLTMDAATEIQDVAATTPGETLGPQGPGQFVMQPVASEFSSVLESEGQQSALDYAIQTGKVSLPEAMAGQPTYDPALSSLGRTTPLGSGTTRVTIGPSAFASEGQLLSTLGHETVHVNQCALEAQGQITYDWADWEMQAYGWEAQNAGVTGLSATERAGVISTWKQFAELWRRHNAE